MNPLVIILLGGGLLATSVLAEGETLVTGHALVRAQTVDGVTSWRDGGLGRLVLGDEPGAEHQAVGGAVQLVIDQQWSSDGEGRLGATTLGATLHAVARAEPEARGGRAVGVVEAYVEAVRDVGEADRVRLRLGHFLLGTSFENIEPAWASPYSSTFSAINSWIGEEVRPTGLEIGFQRGFGEIDQWSVSATAFGGEDTAGTLLAWRGWALGDRLSVWGERLPLAPLPGLEDGAGFGLQRDDGTRPFGDDLDGRVGWSGSIDWQRPGLAALRFTAYDNRGDRGLHGSVGEQEYAWRTRFGLVGGELHTGAWTVIGEWMWGDTGMGDPDGSQVQADFEAWYGLASWSRDAWRATVRYDAFETVDRDASFPYDPNDGSGHAWLAAVMWQSAEWPLRLSLEWLDVEAERPVAESLGVGPEVGGRSVLLEARVFLDG